MTGHDEPFDESLLSAYLDGELDELQRAHVDRVLRDRPDLRATLRRLQVLSSRIRALDPPPAPPALHDGVLRRVQSLPNTDLRTTPSARSPLARAWTVCAALAATILVALSLRNEPPALQLAEQRRDELVRELAEAPADIVQPTAPHLNDLAKTVDKSSPGASRVELPTTAMSTPTDPPHDLQVVQVEELSEELQRYVRANDVSAVLTLPTNAVFSDSELIQMLTQQNITVENLGVTAEKLGQQALSEGDAIQSPPTVTAPEAEELAATATRAAEARAALPAADTDTAVLPRGAGADWRLDYLSHKREQMGQRSKRRVGQHDTLVVIEASREQIQSLTLVLPKSGSQERGSSLTRRAQPSLELADGNEAQPIAAPDDTEDRRQPPSSQSLDQPASENMRVLLIVPRGEILPADESGQPTTSP